MKHEINSKLTGLTACHRYAEQIASSLVMDIRTGAVLEYRASFMDCPFSGPRHSIYKANLIRVYCINVWSDLGSRGVSQINQYFR